MIPTLNLDKKEVPAQLGSISPRPERQMMRHAAAEFAERGESVSVSLNLEFDTGVDTEDKPLIRRMKKRSSPDFPSILRRSTITAVTAGACGSIAVGDSGGRVYVTDAEALDVSALSCAYTAVIDPLKSVEVSPSVASLAFLHRRSPTIHLLCTNEKVPKLYKIIESRDCPPPSRAIDSIGNPRVGPLTIPRRAPSMKLVSSFAMEHEYNIHSLFALRDGNQFLSVDDVDAKLWDVNHCDVPLDVLSIKPPGDENPSDRFLSACLSPSDPVLLFVTTFSGLTRVFDIRQRLKWSSHDAMSLQNEAGDDPPWVVSSAHSPSGTTIATRDSVAVSLYDMRRGQRIHRTTVQPYDEQFGAMKPSLHFSGNGGEVLTGTTVSAVAAIKVKDEGTPRFFGLDNDSNELTEDNTFQHYEPDPLHLLAKCDDNNFAVCSQRSLMALDCSY